MEGGEGPVCVTGGTGFLGSWLIMRLLHLGYYVRTTVRSDPEHKKDLSFLTSLPGASERLQIFSADLNDPESFSAPIAGCIGVFHLATPIDLGEKEPEEVVTEEAVSGTLGILKACVASKTVKRVVYTSSGAAVLLNGQEVDEMDESFWSDIDFIKAQKQGANSYPISKTLIERTVFEFGEKNGLEVVSIIPSFVVGPFISPQLRISIHVVLAMALGDKDGHPYVDDADIVHVDDVISAHIFLLECPTAKGRSLKEAKSIRLPRVSSKKLLDTGFKFKYGRDEMLAGAIQCCKEKGFL